MNFTLVVLFLVVLRSLHQGKRNSSNEKSHGGQQWRLAESGHPAAWQPSNRHYYIEMASTRGSVLGKQQYQGYICACVAMCLCTCHSSIAGPKSSGLRWLDTCYQLWLAAAIEQYLVGNSMQARRTRNGTLTLSVHICPLGQAKPSQAKPSLAPSSYNLPRSDE